MGWNDDVNAETMAHNAAAREYEPRRQAFLAAQDASRQAQNNWQTLNNQKQAQQGFENQGVLRTRGLEDQAREAASTGDLNAIKYLQSMDQGSGPEGTMTGPGGAPMHLRPGETPITSGMSSGASPAIPSAAPGGQPQMTLERLSKSVLKQNPDLISNPTAYFNTLDRLKPMLVGSDQQRLDQLKFEHQKELQGQKDTAAMERVKARPASGGAGAGMAFVNKYMAPKEQGGDGLTFDEAVDKYKEVKRAGADESGDVAASKAFGKNAEKIESDINNKADGAVTSNRTLDHIKSLGADISMGKMAGAKQDLSAWAQSLGLMDQEQADKTFGSAGSSQALTKAVLPLVSQAVHDLTSRSAVQEFNQFVKSNPNIEMTPDGFNKVIGWMQKVNDLTIKKQEYFQEWKKDHKAKDYNNFSYDWNKKLTKEMDSPTQGGDKQPQSQTDPLGLF